MTKKELAAKLNGNKCDDEISTKLAKEAKRDGLVVVFGQSDYVIAFRGAINEEVDAYNGAEFKIGPEGIPRNECHDPECPYFEKIMEGLRSITADWNGDSEYSWDIHGTMDCAYFDIMENGEKYCRGVVFDM